MRFYKAFSLIPLLFIFSISAKSNFDFPVAINNLISHGDFESENLFHFPLNVDGVANLTTEAPIAGQQSLMVNFTDFSEYSPFYYTYNFPENSQLKHLRFNGLLQMLAGADTESIIAEAHVTYHNDGQYPYSYERVNISGTGNAVTPFNVNLALDETRKIKHVNLKFLFTKQQQDLSILLDNLELYVVPKGVDNLIPHGDFESESLFHFPLNVDGVANLTTEAPIAGQQSLMVNFTDFNEYSPFYYTYNFPENTQLKSLCFNGLLQMLAGADTESIIAEAHVTYHNDGQYPYDYDRVIISGTGNAVTPFNVDLSLDETRSIKHVNLKFLYTKQEQDLTVLLDNIQLNVVKASSVN